MNYEKTKVYSTIEFTNNKSEKSKYMTYDKMQLFIKPLPASVIIKNYIEGHPIDCEEYLTEFVNFSKLKKDKGNETFILRKHCEQSQKQSDIYNSFYELDFKILVDTRYMEAKSTLSNSVTELCPGVTQIGPSKFSGSKTAFDIIKCFRGKTEEDLRNIEQGLLKLPEGKVIRQTMQKISVNKNIMFFLPYDYSFKNQETDFEGAKLIADCISKDLKSLLAYRKMKVTKDTYIAFISERYFVITEEKESSLIFYDMIKTSDSNLYSFLYSVGKL